MSNQSLQCTVLTALLGQQKVALPGSSAYTASLGSYFSQQEAAVQPACIVLSQTALDVSAAVVALQKPENGQRCSFAVRSGGHTAWAGAANIAGGVVIDLAGLNAVELSADLSTVSVGVGASWDMVYAKLDPLGLSVNGGRAAGVGEFRRRTGQEYIPPFLPLPFPSLFLSLIMRRCRGPFSRRGDLLFLTSLWLDLRYGHQLPDCPC